MSEIEQAWLIEASLSGPPIWLSILPSRRCYEWTSDPNVAIRFSRKVDAEQMIELWSLFATATEHGWQDSAGRLDQLADELDERHNAKFAEVARLRAALAGLRDLCEMAGMPCDLANDLLRPIPLRGVAP